MTDMFICKYMENCVVKGQYKALTSGLNTLMFMAHGKEADFLWAMDLKRAAAANREKKEIPAEDLGPLFELVRREYSRFQEDEANLGRNLAARFRRVRTMLLALLRVDTGARSMDMAGLPLARWRTVPLGAKTRAADRVYMRFRRPKEELLRTDGLCWSGEVYFEQDAKGAGTDYWACATGTWWDIYVDMRKRLRSKAKQGKFKEFNDRGLRILDRHAFTDDKGKPIGEDRISNTVRDLLVEAGIISEPTGLSTFTAKHLRHHFATVCQRLMVEDGLMEKSEVLAALRHAGGGSLKYYTAVDVHPMSAADATMFR